VRPESSVRTIALIGGTGNLGRGLALRWSPNHRVMIGSRFRRKAEGAAEQVRQRAGRDQFGQNVFGTLNREAIADADLVVFCVRLEPALKLAAKMKKNLEGKLILSPIVPIERRKKLFVPKPSRFGSAAVQLAKALGPKSNVIAGLHTVPAAMLYSLQALPDYSVVVYGEEPGKSVVMGLISEIDGLHPLDGGPLELSFLSEYTTPLLMNLKRLNQPVDRSVRYF